MPPFSARSIIDGFKERIESIATYADRLYIGTALGNLHVYALNKDEDGNLHAAFEDCKKGLSRKPIEQLGYIKDVNSLVMLSDGAVTLFPSPSYAPPTLLTQAKGAMSFEMDTTIQYTADGQSGELTSPRADGGIPTVVTRLAVGCRRKIVIYTWKDGEPQEVKEHPLPHSPRSIVFSTPNVLLLSYTNADHVLLKLPLMSVTDLTLSPPPVLTGAAALGKGALSGLTGYMNLGLGPKAKPSAFKVSEIGETVVTKEQISTFFNPDGQITRPGGHAWPAPPDETVFVKPYMLSVLPAGSLPPASSAKSLITTQGSQTVTAQLPSIQIVSSLSMRTVQTLSFPFSPAPGGKDATSPVVARVLTPSPAAKAPLFVTTTPVDRTLAGSEGSVIWSFSMEAWGSQVDELVDAGNYTEALSLLDLLDVTSLPDKEDRILHTKSLRAVTIFSEGKYMEAIKSFVDLDVNPARVIALYPEAVAGRLSVPRSKWIQLYGGKSTAESAPLSLPASEPESKPGPSTGALIAGGLKATLETLIPAIPEAIPGYSIKEDDTKATTSATPQATKPRDKTKDEYSKSVETLLVFLGDRRPKLFGALQAISITAFNPPKLPSLSETPVEELFALPNEGIQSLSAEHLVRYAQIVDTALLKSYLIIRLSLVGSLCRLENWCEVAETEAVLRERKYFAELIDLYKGKRMHDKALALLKDLGKNETDLNDKLDPTVSYLQKLGPEHLSLVLHSSDWVMDSSTTKGLMIFKSEDVELPRRDVALYLSKRDPNVAAAYLQYLVDEKKEVEPSFHNWLAELYIEATLSARGRKDDGGSKRAYDNLLAFLDSSSCYDVDRVFLHLPVDDLFEARAILLGRLGKHEAALDIYVNRLHDPAAAEKYCKKAYQLNPDRKGAFLILLRIYLRPSGPGGSTSLSDALDLISRHTPRLDTSEALQLLPPLVNASDVRVFLMEALKSPRMDTRITKELWKARGFQVDRKLVALQSQRLKITDTRLCPQCHKRLGNSVIAVHAPRGEVTHYQCREAFAARQGATISH